MGTIVMVDERPEDTTPPPGSGRAKRAPPTIDLEASEVSGDTQNPGAGAERKRAFPLSSAAAISAGAIAAVSGAGAAALVIGVAWLAGWPGQTAEPPAPAAPQVSAATIDGLAARIASVESKTNTPPAPAPDPAAVARSEAVDKSIAALRGELAGLRTHTEKLAAAVNEVKSGPRETATPVDLT